MSFSRNTRHQIFTETFSVSCLLLELTSLWSFAWKFRLKEALTTCPSYVSRLQTLPSEINGWSKSETGAKYAINFAYSSAHVSIVQVPRSSTEQSDLRIASLMDRALLFLFIFLLSNLTFVVHLQNNNFSMLFISPENVKALKKKRNSHRNFIPQRQYCIDIVFNKFYTRSVWLKLAFTRHLFIIFILLLQVDQRTQLVESQPV